ncbi:hypothetical protein QC762_206380 [Podospora pseudocomata]|uniref:Uncharacterized protein n=1 Tax=Podospora pseudocomata TaxID=2093779 RepID=A0ABR0GM38_9PEZI|nr:hypothetical protein QC762_206380 [Podospora pseudocomata]
MKLTISNCILLLAALDVHAAQARALPAEPGLASTQLSERAYRGGNGIPSQNGVSRGRFGASPAKRDDSPLDTRTYRVGGGTIPGPNDVSRGRFGSSPAKRQTYELGDLIDIIDGLQQRQVERRQAESTAFPVNEAPQPVDTAIPIPEAPPVPISTAILDAPPAPVPTAIFDAPPAPISTAIPDAPPAPIDTAIPNVPSVVIGTQIPVTPVSAPVVTEVPVFQVADGFITAIRARQNTAVNGDNVVKVEQATSVVGEPTAVVGQATAVVGEPSRPIRTEFAIVANVIYE